MGDWKTERLTEEGVHEGSYMLKSRADAIVQPYRTYELFFEITFRVISKLGMYEDIGTPEECRKAMGQPNPRWIPVSERQPDKPGVYLVTVFNREWVGDDIMQGARPPKDEYWDDHKNIYAGRQDGKWVMTGQRVWNGECWTGYGEIQLAWMEMPEPYTDGEGT